MTDGKILYWDTEARRVCVLPVYHQRYVGICSMEIFDGHLDVCVYVYVYGVWYMILMDFGTGIFELVGALFVWWVRAWVGRWCVYISLSPVVILQHFQVNEWMSRGGSE